MLDAPSPIARKLRQWQALLLDLSRANRLLYFKADRASAVPLTQPDAAELYLQLVTRGKALTFPLSDAQTLFDLDQAEADPTTATELLESTAAPVPAPNPIEPAPPTGPAEAVPAGKPAARKKTATTLGTSLTDERLSRALYNLRARSRAALEEQGVNVLYVAFGLLHWIDPDTKEPAQSPLVLVPVALGRESLGRPYTLSMLEEDVILNPTLIYKLQLDFNVTLPDVPEDADNGGLAVYLDHVREAVADRSGWSVTADAVLGVFSFHKINLYQDLAVHQAAFAAHPVIGALSGTAPLPPPPAFIPAIELDDRVPPDRAFQVIDADSSQQEAIQAARLGASFVLQGPPGTGKSQTITNIIAEFLAAGKRVLFVSQKMAALEVVQRRLTEAGLGEFCLQLHSHKRDKREVVAELVAALSAPELQMKPDYEAVLLDVQVARQKLNAYARGLHTPRFALHATVFEAHGQLAALRTAAEVSFPVGDVTTVSAGDLAQRLGLLERLAALPQVIDAHATHPWRGAAIQSISFALRDQLARSLADLGQWLPQAAVRCAAAAAACGLAAPRNLIAARPLLDLLQEVEPRLFALDLDALRDRFATKYQSVLRGVLGDYRADMAALADARRAKDKLSFENAVALIDRARHVRDALTRQPGQSAATFTAADGRDTLALLHQIEQAARPLTEVYNADVIGTLDMPHYSEQIAVWRGGLPLLADYAAFNRLRAEAPALQLAYLVDAALAVALPAARWREAYRLAFWRGFVDAAALSDEALRTFDSRAHTALIERFRAADRQQLIIARARIRALLSERRPKSSWLEAATAEQTILRREAAKKRRLKPLRKLFAEIPRLITELKPCLLMSPITVSLLLDPDVFQFDLVIFDEASQIATEEAVGAIVRGMQTVIVGDKQQLPPTRFFEVVGGDNEDDAGDGEAGRMFDSILEESEGLNLPQKMLRWHYRSRDESLIAFSNRHFYADRLFTFPNVRFDGEQLGVQFVFVPDGVYQRGHNLRRNDVEARRVVDLIFQHAAQSPDKTLGVIAFSYAQRDAIRLEWERRRREQPEHEAFFNEDAAEPFFIKNLEMVQGDERDVIFFSVGYGKDETGKLIYNFGPLNQAGGERRLNVAVSRARFHVKLVASIQPEDIDVTRTTSQGAQLLRAYMLLARDGVAAWHGRAAQPLAADTDTPFEEVVRAALQAEGLQVQPQVGTSAYRVDLAVVDAAQPDRYALGIECDGATYYTAQTARDRDRLRQQVLGALGWRLHRVWSRDWVADADREVAKILAALAAPASAPIDPPGPIEPPPPAAPADLLAHAPVVPAPQALPTYVWPLKRARLTPHDKGEELGKADPALVATEVVRVVKAEGPVHVEQVTERVLAAWGVGRLGKRIQAVLTKAIEAALASGQVLQRENFLWPAGLEKAIVRAPDRLSSGESDEPRSIEHIAPEELAQAVLLCVTEARSLSADDVVRATAQVLGYERATAKVEAPLHAALSQLVAAGQLAEVDGVVRVSSG